jgi:hypothetical protein
MATFKTRVESIIGSVSPVSLLDTWLTSGAKFILVQIPSAKLAGYAQEINFTNSVSLWNKKLIGITVGGYDAKSISPGKVAQVTDSTSIHYATALTPAYTIKGDNLHVYPTNSSATLFAINYPEVANTDSSIANFPPELEDGVVYFACITGLLWRSLDKMTTDIASLQFNAPTAPAAISKTFTVATSLPTFTLAPAPLSSTINPFVQAVSEFSTDNAKTYTRVDEDLEKAAGELQIQQALVAKYNEDIQNANALFQSELAKYKALVETEVTRYNVQYQAELSKYGAEVSKVRADLEMEVQQYLAKVQNYQNLVQSEVQRITTLINRVKIYTETNSVLASSLQTQLTALIQGFING